MNNKIFALGILAIVAVGITTSIFFNREMSKRPAFKDVGGGEVQASLNLTGKVIPQDSADLGFERGGKITNLKHAVGDSVTEGEPLAYVNDADLTAQYRQARDLVGSSEALLEQYQELTKKEKAKLDSLKKQKTGVNSADKRAQDKQIEASEAMENSQESQIEAAEANVDSIKAQLDKTVITAPFDGIITKQDVEVGETAQPNVPIITLASQNDFKIETFVSEMDLKNIQSGDSAKITLDGKDSNQSYPAKVTAIDPAETMINNVVNYKVTLNFDGDISDLRSGTGANITLATPNK